MTKRTKFTATPAQTLAAKEAYPRYATLIRKCCSKAVRKYEALYDTEGGRQLFLDRVTDAIQRSWPMFVQQLAETPLGTEGTLGDRVKARQKRAAVLAAYKAARRSVKNVKVPAGKEFGSEKQGLNGAVIRTSSLPSKDGAYVSLKDDPATALEESEAPVSAPLHFIPAKLLKTAAVLASGASLTEAATLLKLSKMTVCRHKTALKTCLGYANLYRGFSEVMA